ncbi:hypothetical protein K2173_007364 [Erythroxylum novogranatense]|uniref:MLO-like protein n=1 Tax=Erythroxylum novogranatense TaxID=1862640 RepID=A0AAV8T6I0_9ROSI|nr:hypothetical protein K2173_007364 [Erythroxylum novogranatense]
MGGGGGGGPSRELDETPTWAVAAVCAAIVVISIILENFLHRIGELFREGNKKAMYEALEKVKGELMVLGFISLLLTFSQGYVSQWCILERYGNTMLPCPRKHSRKDYHGGAAHADAFAAHAEGAAHADKGGHHRRLLWYDRRSLAGGGGGATCKEGYVPLISLNGLHQLHIFIFFLAVFHVIYSAITMMLGRLKIRGWKDWERESWEEETVNGPKRFRLTHETSFVREHTSFWTRTPVTFYIACFFNQFFRSVQKADYLAMRNGFISVHLAPGSKFNFQKYIKRSLEDDFKVVVGISPLLWASVVIFLLFNVHGWHVSFWYSVLPLIVILAVGTKLQGIITEMAVEIQQKHAVVQGIPLVQVSDRHFWFSWPELVLYLIHFVLFQNAFELTYFFWIWYEFGLKSCFHEDFVVTIMRVTLGLGAQILCSYITLPLYALVTQMGTTMKRSVFDEQTSKALRQWQNKAKKKEQSSHTKTLGSPTDSPMASPAQSGSHANYANHAHSHSTSDLEAYSSNPAQTANIMATIDLDNEKSNEPYVQRDLLS